MAIRAHLAAPPSSERPGANQAAQTERAAAAWRRFERHLTWWQRWTVLPRARVRARWIKQYYIWRERCRSDMMKVASVLRRWHLVLAARFVDRGWIASTDDYFLLKLSEVGEAIRNPSTAGRLRTIAAARAADLARYRQIPMPLLMRESELPRLIATSGIAGSGDPRELTGHGVSGGSVEAEVAVILDPADFDRMRRGAILVTRATDPSWTPLFTLASGVIVEVGGVLSHASTIAREFGLPALANVRHATKLLRTGERVRLDATRGIVTKLDATTGSSA
jgi:pyruvate,water dikinase